MADLTDKQKIEAEIAETKKKIADTETLRDAFRGTPEFHIQQALINTLDERLTTLHQRMLLTEQAAAAQTTPDG